MDYTFGVKTRIKDPENGGYFFKTTIITFSSVILKKEKKDYSFTLPQSQFFNRLKKEKYVTFTLKQKNIDKKSVLVVISNEKRKALMIPQKQIFYLLK